MQVIAKTLDPQWDEVHNFVASLQSARQAKLQVEVFDNDFLSRDDSLGVGEIELSKIFGDEVRTTYITTRAPAGHLLVRVIRAGGGAVTEASAARQIRSGRATADAAGRAYLRLQVTPLDQGPRRHLDYAREGHYARLGCVRGMQSAQFGLNALT